MNKGEPPETVVLPCCLWRLFYKKGDAYGNRG